jgi:PAS domain-containing protein
MNPTNRQLKASQKARRQKMFWKKTGTTSKEYSESIINTVREPLIALDQDLRVVSVSRSFYEVFKVNPVAGTANGDADICCQGILL